MSQTTPVVLDEYLKLHPADLADRLQCLDTDEARALLRELPAEKAATALASSIFLTTVTDVAGFFFFLGLATLGLKWMGL